MNDKDVDLNVALGFEDPPPDFNYSQFEALGKGHESEVFREKEYRRKVNKSVFLGEEEWLKRLDLVNLENESNDENEGAARKQEYVTFETEGSEKQGKEPRTEVPVKEEDKPETEIPDKPETEIPDKPETEVPDKPETEVPDKQAKQGKQQYGCDDNSGVDEFALDKESQAKVVAAICGEIEEKLKLGTEFPDLETVYILYCEYARFKGFGVRKGEQRYFGRCGGNIRWKEFICSATGFPNCRSAKHKLALYKKLVTRSNCKAKLIVSREDMGSFVVTTFEKEHNHELLTCDQSFLLRSACHMSYAKKSVLEALNSAGIGVATAFRFLCKESGGVQNVGFTKKDAYHHIERVRLHSRVEDADAKLLSHYFTNKANFDPFFFWEYQLDDEGRLMNIFFRDNKCALDYFSFGDVLSVDTTYRTNKYNLICCPFVGINHHASNVMFGMALMSDETTESFKWLFETFLKSMHGKQPKVIYTDQCRAMMNAIDVVFPNSKHRLCQWHIMKNCLSNFGKLNEDTKFKQLWYRCMNVVETEHDFDTTSNEMMQNFDIENKSWYDSMFNLRDRWASCFSRGVFTAGLLATSRSELTNKVLKSVVRRTISLSIFVVQYEEILKSWRSTEHAEDTYGIWRPGQAISDNGLLMKAASVYSRNIYKIFEYDLANCINVLIDRKTVITLPDNNLQFLAKDRRSSHQRTVVLNPATNLAICDCGRWETEGLICQHILKVYVIENLHDFPDSMICSRWTKAAKELKSLENEIIGDESHVMRHMTFANNFMRNMSDMVSFAMQKPSVRQHVMTRMKEMDAEFRQLLSISVESEPAATGCPIIVPLFRNPRKVAPRGFANTRQGKGVANGRKRAANPASQSRRKPRTKKSRAAGDTDEENNIRLTL